MARKKKKGHGHRSAKQRAASRRNIQKAQRAAAKKPRTHKQIAAAKRNLAKGRKRRR